MTSTPATVSTNATQIGELKHVGLVTRSLLKDVRLRHTSTKKLLKEDLLATMRELSDASSKCHYAENQVTQLNKYAASVVTTIPSPTFFLHRAVSELNRRLETLNKEAEAKRLQGRGGQSTKPFVQRYNTFASSSQPVRHLTPAVQWRKSFRKIRN